MIYDNNTWAIINRTLRLRDIDPSQFRHVNCVRLHPRESLEHFMTKCRLSYESYKKKHPFLTEVWTMDHSRRYDFLDLIDNLDYEMEKSESRKKYKGDIEVEVR